MSAIVDSVGGEEVATQASGSNLAETELESFCACVGATVPPAYVLRERDHTFVLPPILLVMVASSLCPGALLRQFGLRCSGLDVHPCVQQKLLPRSPSGCVAACAARRAVSVSAALA